LLPITVNWERAPSAPSPVFGVNTKQVYNPQPTDNIFDSGNFDKTNPNMFMGKRANDGSLNFMQYGYEQDYQGMEVNFAQWHNPMFTNRFSQKKMFYQNDNSAWESNVNWAGGY
jgi:hypothetical protein